MSVAKSAATAILVLAAIQLGTHWISAGFTPGKIRAPLPGFGVPLQMKDWTGRDVAQDPMLVQSLGAIQQLDREYHNGSGSQVQVHVACWDDAYEGMPHVPVLCYTGNGWEIAGQNPGTLKVSSSRSIPYNRLLLHRDGRFVQVAYWYQMGQHAYINRNGLRDARKEHWGQAEWPPVTKVLLHRVVPTENTSFDDLNDIAAQLAAALRNS